MNSRPVINILFIGSIRTILMRNNLLPLAALAASSFVCQVALAAPATVFYEADNANVVLGQVVVATGLAPDAFKLVTIEDAFSHLEPVLTGTAEHRTCSSPRGGTQKLLEAISKAEQALMYMETEKVASAYKEGQNAITCLNEPLPQAEAARLNFLAGIAAMQSGDKISAWDAFRAAWILDPEIQWDPNYPKNAKRVFQLAINEAKATEKVDLTLTVPAPEGGFWWNGRTVPHGTIQMKVDTGEQIVQWSMGDKVATYRFTVQEGLAPIVAIPATVPSEFPRWVSDNRARQKMDSILPLALTEGEDVLIVVGGGVWKTQVGWDEWTELTPPTQDIMVSLPEPLNLELNPLTDVEVQAAAVETEAIEAEILQETIAKPSFEMPAFWRDTPVWAKATAPVLLVASGVLAAWAKGQSSEILDWQNARTTALDNGEKELADQYLASEDKAKAQTQLGWTLAGGALVGAGVTIGIGFEF
jgi:hypothetical protein